MSLTKIPFILLATWAFNTSMTSPNTPAPKKEHFAIRAPLENPTYVQWAPFFVRFSQLVFCVAEIATIVASANPTLPLSPQILSMLVWNGAKPDNLRMSNVTAIGLILMVLGTSIRLMTFRYLGRFFRFQVSIQEDHELIVSGPYAVVRHPSYSGLLILFIGWFPWQMSEGSWIIESGLWDMTLGRSFVMINIALIFMGAFQLVLVRTQKEDAALKKHFGTKWDNWAKDVPYAIIPGIY